MVFNAILELMPKLVHSLWLIVHSRKWTTDYGLQTADCRRRRYGFSLIEILIVITLFGVSASLVTVSYLGFERGQRLGNAAALLKSDIRLAQNKALSGDKGAGGTCAANSTLGGWYVKIVGSGSSYRVAGVCLTGAPLNVSEAEFNPNTVNFPRGVKVNLITYGSNTFSEAYVFFRSLTNKVTVHGAMVTPPDFFDNLGNLQNQLGTGSDLVIELEAPQVTGRYQVIVKQTGEVNEIKQ